MTDTGETTTAEVPQTDAPWLIGLDVDGTIILEDESPSPGVFAEIARLAAAGHEVMLATGRSWNATGPIMERLGIRPDYAVCSNGAVLMRREGDGYVREFVELFDPSTVLALLAEHLPDARYMVELEDGTRLYTAEMDYWNLHGGRCVPLAELGAQLVSRVVVVSPDHDEESFRRIVDEAGLNEVSYAVGWTAWLDIAPQGVDKGTGLARVREMLGTPGDRVLVVGDGRNDLGMFAWALAAGGRAVAMGQAAEDVRAAAGEITAAVARGGLADVLRTVP